MTEPLISVIMPAYNAECYIQAALRSLLRETDIDLDIIVVDDGSTDRTADLVQSMMSTNSAIRLLKLSHSGVSRARNEGLLAVPAQAQYITFLDSDDLNVPGSIERQLRIFQHNNDLACVIGLIQLFEVADEEKCVPLSGSRVAIVRSVQLSAALFSRYVFDRLGGFNEEMEYGEDADFFFRLMELGTSYFTEDEVAVLYRRHSGNMTNDVYMTRRGFADAIRRSLARRRESGAVTGLGELFKTRSNAEEMFKNV